MDRRLTAALPYVSSTLATAGIAYLAWQLTILQGGVVESRVEVQAIRAQLDAERGERASLEARSADLSRRAEDLRRSLADAREALAASGQDVGQSIRRIEARSAVIEAGFSGIREEL